MTTILILFILFILIIFHYETPDYISLPLPSVLINIIHPL